MSITLNADPVSGDWSLYGYAQGTTDYTSTYRTPGDTYDASVAAMQADSWSKDAAALQPAGVDWSEYFDVHGHLVRKSNGHLRRKSNGHLVRQPHDSTGWRYTTTAIADAYNTTAYEGTSVTSLRFTASTILDNVTNTPGSGSWSAIICFRITDIALPSQQWSWLSGSPYTGISWTATTGATQYTVTGLSITLGKWFWMVYGLLDYSFRPTLADQHSTGFYWSYGHVGVGLSNTIVLNP